MTKRELFSAHERSRQVRLWSRDTTVKARRLCGGILLLANCVLAQGTLSGIAGYGTTPINGYVPFGLVYASDTVGWSFTTSQDIEVTALGLAPGADPNTGPGSSTFNMEFGLWSGNGTLLASATANVGGGTSFAAIGPVLLQPGESYVVGAWGGNQPLFFTIPLESIPSPQIQPIDVALSAQNTFGFPTPSGPAASGSQPQELSQPLANFQFVDVPEPSVFWLTGTGLIAFGCVHAARRRIPYYGGGTDFKPSQSHPVGVPPTGVGLKTIHRLVNHLRTPMPSAGRPPPPRLCRASRRLR
jgi:hypothetical protein